LPPGGGQARRPNYLIGICNNTAMYWRALETSCAGAFANEISPGRRSLLEGNSMEDGEGNRMNRNRTPQPSRTALPGQFHLLISLSQDCAWLVHGLFSTRPVGTTERCSPMTTKQRGLMTTMRPRERAYFVNKNIQAIGRQDGKARRPPVGLCGLPLIEQTA